jgi:hypothetical protein
MELNRIQARHPYTTLTKVTFVAMVSVTLAYASELISLGLDREVSIIVGLLTLGSVLVATGWRWTPALGALLAGGIVLGNPFLLYNLSQPITSSFFLAAMVQVISTVVVVAAGIGATVQNYRKK